MLAPHCQKQAARPWLRRFGAGMAVLGLCVSTLAQAFTIGHARVESAIDEPLQFSVLITAIDPATIEQLDVQVAPAAAWQALGLQPLSAVLDAQGQLLPAHTPAAVCARFFSPQPVDEPFIDCLDVITL